MNTSNKELRATIAHEAVEWFAASREGALDSAGRRAFFAWLKTSPLHIQEYLGLTLLARDVRAAADDPAMPLDALIERARNADEVNVPPLDPSVPRSVAPSTSLRLGSRWRLAAAAMAVAVIGSVLFWLNFYSPTPQRYATRHGEQRTWRLADDSVLRLNTDTAVTVRYGRAERLVEIDHGEALFEVAHEPGRPFRVIAGTAVVTATGTQFDVYRQGVSTLVTVVEGQVTVAPVDATRTVVPVSAGEEVRVTAGVVAAPAPADIQRNIAWLRRQIVFKHQPLAAVAAEFNRYGVLPIEIETPALRTLAISGIFTADDTETFIAFLRTLDGVTVETTPTQIRVLGQSAAAPANPPTTH